MKYLVVYNVTEGKWHKQFTIEYETYQEMLEAINEVSYEMKVYKIYEIAKEIKL